MRGIQKISRRSKLANAAKQKGENGATMIAKCEDYLIIEDKECYCGVCDDVMSWVVDTGVSFRVIQRVFYVLYQQHRWPGKDGK